MTAENEGDLPDDGRSRRAQARRERARANILAAAVEVFSTSGYHQSSISDLHQAAGIARGTFYQYFESKNAVFLELMDELLVQLRSSVVGVDTRPGAPPVALQLYQTVRRILEAASQNRALTTILMREAVGLDEEVDRRLAEFYDSLHAWVVLALENGRASGLVRDGVDVEIAATCVIGSLRFVLERAWAQSDGGDADLDLDRMARAILDVTAFGLLARK
ncbi:MAG: helix-turn-helix transcriptional regulator [Myxococcales bacterium]|nr:helix-turn-helix transcriptional regulator [Myxococcales bacterium]MCB9731031.1 helix-turn-helix transcriptional regulator [Deltaproteobacteria bacterium]